MRLLATNDDGIDSPFLHVLVHALRNAGHELYVVAPKQEQSWTGASKSRHRPVVSAVVDRGLGCPTWTVDGTPSDCVNIGLAYLLPRADGASRAAIDAVVSGMNVGFNLSLGFILASGTIAGAWEGALHGLPAIAFSQDLTHDAFEHIRQGLGPDDALAATLAISAAHATRLVDELVPHTPPHSFTVHNVNFPFTCRPDTPVERTVPARLLVEKLFGPAADDGTHRFIYSDNFEDVSPRAGDSAPTDRATIFAGKISHTVLDYTKLGWL
ncbi:MAG TPA: 5'/3'-nucleotidase SurE [Opitutaceae bacterium]